MRTWMFRTWFLSTSTMPVDQEATVDKKYSSADASPTSLRNSSSAAGGASLRGCFATPGTFLTSGRGLRARGLVRRAPS